ncbi:pollen-specific leucine-rich repeat extensin-like protein 1 [Homalodisca vitripennis]|uniref:pollen-specific leucine-rich repeat extensin-like protein 1 n=1 Tax=Homalodisca vitripennis TaxID=197043 RepID=UPI001EECD34E|nr:pollen-specific leucine-rich repeat extensin-like protein 1 [Homalodisca vitripennis]
MLQLPKKIQRPATSRIEPPKPPGSSCPCPFCPLWTTPRSSPLRPRRKKTSRWLRRRRHRPARRPENRGARPRSTPKTSTVEDTPAPARPARSAPALPRPTPKPRDESKPASSTKPQPQPPTQNNSPTPQPAARIHEDFKAGISQFLSQLTSMETHFRTTDRFSIPNYQVYRTDRQLQNIRPQRRLGDPSTSTSDSPTPGSSPCPRSRDHSGLPSSTVELNWRSPPCIIPPQRIIQPRLPRLPCCDLGSPALVAGDLKRQNTWTWGRRNTNSTGRDLHHHVPVVFDFPDDGAPSYPPTRPNKINWHHYANYLADRHRPPPTPAESPDQLDRQVLDLTTTLQEAMTASSSPLSRTDFTPPLPEELREEIRLRRQTAKGTSGRPSPDTQRWRHTMEDDSEVPGGYFLDSKLTFTPHVKRI